MKVRAADNTCNLVRDEKGLSVRLTGRVVLTAILAVLGGGFHFGFQISIINPMADVLQSFLLENFQRRYSLSLTQSDLSLVWSTIAGSLFIGAAFGAYIMSKILEVHGPKCGILCSALVLVVSTPLTGLSHLFSSPELFVLSRLLSGIGVGMGTTAQGVFLAEISPVAYRGVISSFGGLSTNIGFIFASALGLPTILGTKTSWPYAFYVEAIPCLVLIVMNVSWFRDSPVYLLRKGDDRNTYKSLTAYCGFDAAPYEMQRVANEVKSYCTGGDVIWDRAARRALLLSITLNVVVSFSGILAVSFFGTFLLQSIGFTEYTASLANCLSGLSGTLGAVIGTFALDRLGRRLLVVGSLLLLAAVNTSMMLLVYYFNITKETWMGWGFLALFIIFLFLFSAGIGPTAWFLGAELSPAGCRAKMQSMSVSAQYLSCFLSPIIYYPLNASIGPSSFLVFIIPLTLSAVYFHRYLPETKGRTTEEIIAVLNQHELKK
ncbi:transporter, major facilitator family protein [Ancylostoma caninum]|uniref:Transporter, major facilitator family protein n=1 Tax=Ancylostoma caninum TaxID=29170 RepID=A0A368GV47_ANCCA|nr:transporter, major facilitator family protein [Ancylostoma caninum]